MSQIFHKNQNWCLTFWPPLHFFSTLFIDSRFWSLIFVIFNWPVWQLSFCMKAFSSCLDFLIFCLRGQGGSASIRFRFCLILLSLNFLVYHFLDNVVCFDNSHGGHIPYDESLSCFPVFHGPNINSLCLPIFLVSMSSISNVLDPTGIHGGALFDKIVLFKNRKELKCPLAGHSLLCLFLSLCPAWQGLKESIVVHACLIYGMLNYYME